MNTRDAIKTLFLIAAIYDGILGLVFMFVPGRMYDAFDVVPPNHWGYAQFPAALLVVFSLMFLAVARNPEKNRNLIPYGVLLKAAYCGVVFWHWATQGIPAMWKPFAVSDFAFGLLFIWAYGHLGKR